MVDFDPSTPKLNYFYFIGETLDGTIPPPRSQISKMAGPDNITEPETPPDALSEAIQQPGEEMSTSDRSSLPEHQTQTDSSISNNEGFFLNKDERFLVIDVIPEGETTSKDTETLIDGALDESVNNEDQLTEDETEIQKEVTQASVKTPDLLSRVSYHETTEERTQSELDLIGSELSGDVKSQENEKSGDEVPSGISSAATESQRRIQEDILKIAGSSGPSRDDITLGK